MQYDYERLNPDRFQELCQSLIVREFPGAQCFPVGQKDGGRDSTAKRDGRKINFQVKFKRDRLAGEDHYAYLKKSIDGEKDNIDKLASDGFTDYIVVTNLAGSSARSSGAMDKTASHLKKVLPKSVAGQIWWRNDLDARLNNAYDLKWIFSEVLTAADVFRYLLAEKFDEREIVRYLAIRSYMELQYESDKNVKFKQANLESSALLSLFIDVPGRLLTVLGQSERRGLRAHVANDLELETARFTGSGASMLLGSKLSRRAKRVVVEGGPGQGKSTLAQYICQVQRMKLLRKSALSQIPAGHKDCPTKIPFKVDLRDFSSWLQRRSPATGESSPADEVPSLEGFLAAQVRQQSGGVGFSVDDLLLLASATPFLIVLDGLDEVASHADRRLIIDAVNSTSIRMASLSAGSQIIVTSRPAAVASTPRFQSDDWSYLILNSITEPLIFEYIKRWSSAKRLPKSEQDEITAVVRNKLANSQIQDLAHNAMQLTILLNLVHTRGQALPDHRTELYSSYINIYFDRESAKNAVVRDNRQLLIDLHGYIGWKIHCAAEARRNSGRVTQDGLVVLIKEFLAGREHDQDAIESLLRGVVDRIVMIVSQVEGTFEFEVQPLREYFAGYHLYATAPYSPSGQPQKGTKPEIFAAISQNPFWFNVARFYAGAYSVGELASLADQIADNMEVGPGALSSFPRSVSAALLNDRVFHQDPRVARRVIESSTDSLALRYQFIRFQPGTLFNNLVHDDSKNGHLSGILLNRGLHHSTPAIRTEAMEIYSKLVSGQEGGQRWMARRPAADASREDLRRWLSFGAETRLLHSLSTDDARAITSDDPDAYCYFVRIAHPVIFDTLESTLSAVRYAANSGSRFVWFDTAMAPINYVIREPRFQLRGPIGDRRRYLPTVPDDALQLIPVELQDMYRNFVSIGSPYNYKSLSDYIHDLFEIYKPVMQDTWLHWDLALLALYRTLIMEYGDTESKIKSVCPPSDSCPFCYLCEAFANRDRSGWWFDKLQSENAASRFDTAAILCVLAHFGSSKVLRKLHEAIDVTIVSLSEDLFSKMFAANSNSFAPDRQHRLVSAISANKSNRMKAFLGSVLSPGSAKLVVKEMIQTDTDLDGCVAEWCLDIATGDYPSILTPEQYLPKAKSLFTQVPEGLAQYFYVGDSGNGLPVEKATEVLIDVDSYPASLVAAADAVISGAYQKEIKSVSSIARKGRWAANGKR